jgi:hypothetical protein
MAMKWLCGTLLLLCVNTAAGCINAVGTDHEGRRFHPNWILGKELGDSVDQTVERYWLSDARNIIAHARAKPDFEHLTDLGILLVYQGHYAPAIRLFLTIERRYPGHHETAANLGTALELAGHDAPALQWIRIGIQRNAQEHYGTEWLHARILEAKIATARDPSYLDHHSVAGIAFDETLVPELPRAMPAGNDGKPIKPWELNEALGYQLQERTGLVKPRDPIVANLLLDWATLNLAGGPVENAEVIYDLAVTYGAKRDALMRNRQAYIRRVLAQAGDAEPNDSAPCAICRRLEGE